MLQAVDVSFAYRPGGPLVLDRVSLRAARGTIVGLLGPNGSGKTTLIRVLGGLATPRSGRVLLDGEAIARLPRPAVARRLALVPQDTQSAFDFSVLDIVLMGRYPHLGPLTLEGAADLAVAREALRATGTGPLESRPFSTLSGGERQRVVIAAALAQASDALLLDEPTASLDLAYQLEIGALLRRLNHDRGMTMVLSTHDLNLAASLCDRIVLLARGRVLAEGSVEDTLTPDRIGEAFDVEAEVRRHGDAGPLIVTPIARRRPA